MGLTLRVRPRLLDAASGVTLRVRPRLLDAASGLTLWVRPRLLDARFAENACEQSSHALW